MFEITQEIRQKCTNWNNKSVRVKWLNYLVSEIAITPWVHIPFGDYTNKFGMTMEDLWISRQFFVFFCLVGLLASNSQLFLQMESTSGYIDFFMYYVFFNFNRWIIYSFIYLPVKQDKYSKLVYFLSNIWETSSHQCK